jgi:hypothetical protein
MTWLQEKRPELVPRYERLYGGRAYAPERERKRLSALVRRRTPPRPFAFSDSRGAMSRWRPPPERSLQQTEAPAERRPEREAQATLF